MEPIPEVDLAKELKLARDEQLADTTQKVRTKIAYILGKFGEARGSVIATEKALAKAKAAVEKYQKQLVALESGDWGVLYLPEEKPEQKNNPSEAS